MKILSKLFLISLLSLLYGNPVYAEIINLNLLHLNDIYEITPVSSGSSGSLARVATLRQELSSENPHTYTILAGDLFSPSALGTAKVNGQPLAGEQIVSVMNAVGLDYATFGNHEFDLTKEQFYQRLAESKFTWFSSNVLDENGNFLPNVPQSLIFEVTGKNGNSINIGLIGVTIPSNPAEYVTYLDPIETVKQEVNKIKDQTDIIIAVTHLALAQDQYLAENIPEIDLILGGHEHENIQQWRGTDFTPIFKADANARTVYIHQLSYDTDTKQLVINSRLQPITNAIADEPIVADLVNQWLEKGFKAFRSSGFEPEEIVTTIAKPFDGLEVSVRNQSTLLTEAIAQGMLQRAQNAELAIFNGGSIRIDDVLPPGVMTQYDVIRILPFGGQILLVEIKGELLAQILNQGLINKGTGGFLHTANVSFNQQNKQWLINNQPLELSRSYRVAINDFLLTGKEIGLDYLTLDHPDVTLLEQKGDIRFSFINYLQNQN